MTHSSALLQIDRQAFSFFFAFLFLFLFVSYSSSIALRLPSAHPTNAVCCAALFWGEKGGGEAVGRRDQAPWIRYRWSERSRLGDEGQVSRIMASKIVILLLNGTVMVTMLDYCNYICMHVCNISCCSLFFS